MILADKIINERKKNGWSQEELAERLSVSRQSVSKWESAQAVPDLRRILQLAELFGVTTDYLLKEELAPETAELHTEQEERSVREPPLRRVTMEEANEYLETARRNAPRMANGVSACILSPALLIILAGLSEELRFGITEGIAAAAGLIVLLLMVAGAVYTFITSGASLQPFAYLDGEVFETAYGVSGMVGERKKAFERTYTSFIALGVVLCILSVVPLVTAAIFQARDYIAAAMVAVLLLLVAVGVNLIIRVVMIDESYKKLLQEGDYTVNQKKSKKVIEKVSSIYWLIVTAGYLGWSFATMDWHFTWLVWPVAGVLFGAVIGIVKTVTKSE